MILVLNGSPNKNSKTMGITRDLINIPNEEISIINAYDVNIESCRDCKYCDHAIGCKHNDDMNDIYTLLYKADTLIISSPIYFGGLSDKLMVIINRFQRFYSQKYVINDSNLPSFRNIILVSSQGSDKMRMFNGPLETLNILDKLFSPNYIDSILVPESDKKDYINRSIKEQILNIKKRLIK